MARALALAAGLFHVCALARVETAPLVVDDSPGRGLAFDGIGAISGGGATSRLLYDYDPKVASDILDYLFKPNFALSLQMLKVEIGGDTDATEGAEPSHMHARGDENYHRGYEWWLMKEAKKRNPNIKLYGLPWGWPGWLDPKATADRKSGNPFANVKETANYTLQWILGAKRVHGLDIDYVGQWNENNAPPEYAEALRGMVKEHGLRTNVLDRMAHYSGSGTIDAREFNAGMRHGSNRRGHGNDPDPSSCDDAIWNSTNRGWDDEEGSTYDDVMEYQRGGYQESARCLARVVNRAYVNQCRTATIQWYLIDSFYSFLPWRHCGVGVANEPWSGHFEFRSPLWALAHTTQFSEVGWKYLRHNSGVGALRHGGTYVTRVSPDGADWSMVVEKMAPENASCTRGSNPYHRTDAETVTFQVKGKLAKKKRLSVWWSDLSHFDETEHVFKKRFIVELAGDGTFELTVGVNEIFTVTTLTTGSKGHHESPAASPFPRKYSDDFEHTDVYHPPRYWYDQMGAWEVQSDPSSKKPNKVMRQVSTVWPNCWGYSCSGPTTFFGPQPLVDSKVTMDVMLEDDAQWTLNDMKINTDGTWSFGDSLHGGGASFKKNAWHRVEYTVTASYVSAAVDGKQLFVNRTSGGLLLRSVETNMPTYEGKAALKMRLNRYIHASLDNFKIEPVGQAGNHELARHAFLAPESV